MFSACLGYHAAAAAAAAAAGSPMQHNATKRESISPKSDEVQTAQSRCFSSVFHCCNIAGRELGRHVLEQVHRWRPASVIQ